MQDLKAFLNELQPNGNHELSGLREAFTKINDALKSKTSNDPDILPYALRIVMHCGKSDVKEKAGRLALNIVEQNIGLPIYNIFRTAFFVGAAQELYKEGVSHSEIALAQRAANIVGNMLDDPQKSSQLSAPSQLVGARLVVHAFGSYTMRGKSALKQMTSILGFDAARNDIPYPLKVNALDFLRSQAAVTGLVRSAQVDKLGSQIPGQSGPGELAVQTTLSHGAKIVPFPRPLAAARLA